MRNLKEVLEQNKEKYIEELKNLVGIDTHDLGHGIDGGLEKQGQEYMVNLFESMGADEITVDPMDEAVIQESYKKHQEGNLGHNQTDRANVYATFKGKQGGKSLLFNGHIDVMPAEMEDGWTNPPFEPVIRDGKMYGRGCTDMKGGLMASVMAVKLLQDSLEIKPEETMAFGDQLNDIEMLEQAYYSFAVGNARPEVKATARFQTDTNVNDGVLKILKLLL